MRGEGRRGYTLIITPKLVRLMGRVATGRSDARALAIPPFIFVRDKEQIQPWLINHELIHFRQVLDLLLVGWPILWLLEFVTNRIVFRKTKEKSYLDRATEQEAYRNQQDFEYLKHRKFGAVYWYIFHKRKFTFGEPGEIIYLDEMSE